MANPQKENGYTPISNEIMEALARIRIPGEARQLLDVILRKTYGWSKCEDVISLSQFVEMTGLSKTHVCRGINKLLSMNIVTKKGNATSIFTHKGNDYGITYGLQKDFEKWKPLPKKVTLPKKVIDVTQKGNTTLPKKGTTKESNKTIKDKTIELPNWLDEKTWEEFKLHRKNIKKKMTPQAEKLTIKKLDKFRQSGNDPTSVLEESIANGWQGIFELKEKSKIKDINIYADSFDKGGKFYEGET